MLTLMELLNPELDAQIIKDLINNITDYNSEILNINKKIYQNNSKFDISRSTIDKLDDIDIRIDEVKNRKDFLLKQIENYHLDKNKDSLFEFQEFDAEGAKDRVNVIREDVISKYNPILNNNDLGLTDQEFFKSTQFSNCKMFLVGKGIDISTVKGRMDARLLLIRFKFHYLKNIEGQTMTNRELNKKALRFATKWQSIFINYLKYKNKN